MRLVALLSSEGRDGHQFALPLPGHEGAMLPLRLYFFEGELVVTDALPPYDDLVGGVVTALGDIPVDDLVAKTEPLVPRDGPATVPAFQPQFVLRTEVLRGLGVMTGDTVTITVERDGTEAETELTPVPFDEYTDVGGLARRDPAAGAPGTPLPAGPGRDVDVGAARLGALRPR